MSIKPFEGNVAANPAAVLGGRVRSLDDVHSTVAIPNRGPKWRRLLAFAGPAYMVAVGYMDPGNWATDIAGGAKFGYQLIWVLLMSNLMAVLLQSLSVKLGIVTGRDLAQACRETYGPITRWTLFLLCEIAIAACDLAEVLGTAIGINLLTKQVFGGEGIPLVWAVLITGFDVFLLMAIQKFGIRKMEALIISLISIVGLSFIVEIFLSKPSVTGIASGFVPTKLNSEALYVAIGIIGATVMPHNLYLHSALVQTRKTDRTKAGIGQAIRYNIFDSAVALNVAFLVNAAILIVAAATFFTKGIVVEDIGEAHRLLDELLGSKVAPFAFALALICAGQSSTITGTLAGQITMEGFLQFKMRPWLRRLITRSIAIIPAVIVILKTGSAQTYNLLIFSQVILSLQLPFAVIPLVRFTSSKVMMRDFVSSKFMIVLAWIVVTIILGLNGKMLYDQINGWAASDHRTLVLALTIPICSLLGALLVWMMVHRIREPGGAGGVSAFEVVQNATTMTRSIRKIGVAVEISKKDVPMIAEALSQAKLHKAELVLLHIVEGVGGQWHGSAAGDRESHEDEAYLSDLVTRVNQELADSGAPPATMQLGFGSVPGELIRLSRENDINLLLVGGHGHRGLADVVRGTTIDAVRHGLKIPILAIRA